MKYCTMVLICFISLMGLLSCGLEAFDYIDIIPLSEMQDTTRATIRLPSSSAEGYSTFFDNFIIFYKIYTSGENFPSAIIQTSEDRSAINTTLNSDYNYLDNYTDTTTSTPPSTANLESTTFANRNYFKLTLESADIDRVLGSGALGKTLEIFFSPINGTQPILNLDGGASYALQRANDDPGRPPFVPEPDRRFLNHPDLYDRDKANAEINADVAPGTGDIRYTFASMYIAAKGTSIETYSPIYSQPTFIGIFRLAEWSN